MHVLKLGNINNNTRIITCNSCNSGLIYIEDDIIVSYDMDGSELQSWIRCPVCGTYIEIK